MGVERYDGRETLTEQIQMMSENGWGEFFVHPRLRFVIEYLSEEWLDKVHHSVEVTRKSDIDHWQ